MGTRKSITLRGPHADNGDRWLRRAQQRRLCQRTVRAMDVVVIDVLAQHRLQVATPEDQHPVKYFARHGTDPSLGESVALGARTGVLSTSTLAAENTASNMAVNFVS